MYSHQKLLDPDAIKRSRLGRSLEQIIQKACLRLGIAKLRPGQDSEALKAATTELEWQKGVLAALLGENQKATAQKKEETRLLLGRLFDLVVDRLVQSEQLQVYLQQQMQEQNQTLNSILNEGLEKDKSVQEKIQQLAVLELLSRLNDMLQKQHLSWTQQIAQISEQINKITTFKAELRSFQSVLKGFRQEASDWRHQHEDFAKVLEGYEKSSPELADRLAAMREQEDVLASSSQNLENDLKGLDGLVSDLLADANLMEKDCRAQQSTLQSRFYQVEGQQEGLEELPRLEAQFLENADQVETGIKKMMESLKQEQFAIKGEAYSFSSLAKLKTGFENFLMLQNTNTFSTEIPLGLSNLRKLEQEHKAVTDKIKGLLGKGIHSEQDKQAFAALEKRYQSTVQKIKVQQSSLQKTIKEAQAFRQKLGGGNTTNSFLSQYQTHRANSSQPRQTPARQPEPSAAASRRKHNK